MGLIPVLINKGSEPYEPVVCYDVSHRVVVNLESRGGRAQVRGHDAEHRQPRAKRDRDRDR